VHKVEVEPPKSFILNDNPAFTGPFKANLTKAEAPPNRVEMSELGELKNKITPI
jgi:hypothetical protein